MLALREAGCAPVKDGKFENVDELRAWLDRKPPARWRDERDWYEFALEQLDVVDAQFEAGHA